MRENNTYLTRDREFSRRSFTRIAVAPLLSMVCRGQLRRDMASVGTQVSSEQFGLSGDDSTDNTDNLERLRQYLLQNDGSIVTFAPGVYRYKNFQWLQGVRNVTIRGIGDVGLRNVTESPWDFRRVTLVANADMLTGPESLPDLGVASTYPIYTATAGSAYIELIDGTIPSEITPGTTLFVSGYNQYPGGWPPCMRFSETVTAMELDPLRGRIYLTEPLAHTYREDWPAQTFVGQRFGPGTILPLQRQGARAFQLAETRIFDNITFIENPNGPAYINGNGLGSLYTRSEERRV